MLLRRPPRIGELDDYCSDARNFAAVPPEKRDFDEFLDKFKRHHDLMVEELHKVIIGQDAVIEQILAAIFTGGHCLLVGVPGLAKTLVVSTIAQILDVQFKRIQFTPDLMPSDITGTNVLDEDGRRPARISLRPGAGLHEHSAGRRNQPHAAQDAGGAAAGDAGTRSDGRANRPIALPEPFFVIATQNPIEQEGTYPLPEAQLDRFMFNIKVDYPTLEARRGNPLARRRPGKSPTCAKSCRPSRFCICRSRSARSRRPR